MSDPSSASSVSPERSNWILAGVVTCFVLSGFAALLYQTAWLRQFSLVFGTSELAVATVLAAYMAGLAGGAAIAGRYIDRVTRPIRVYGLLEAGIAVTALAVPLLLAIADAVYMGILGGRAAPPSAATFGQPLFYLVVGFLVLALPTGFMGATLPLLTRQVVHTDGEVGPRIALLYATNTAGAVAGTLVAAFLLLPSLGLTATLYVGVAINGLVFAIAALISTRLGSLPEGRHDQARTAPQRRSEFRRKPSWILPIMLASGASSFIYEVLWTRMLAHVLGGSIYAFATMLAAFLTGIAIGGALSGPLAKNRERAAISFSLVQATIAVLSIAVYQWMGFAIPDARSTAALSAFAVAVMLPATLFIGATFPLAVRIMTDTSEAAGTSTARVYAWNTVGAIVGAVGAGFYLIPALGFEGALKLAVMINLALALASVFVVPVPNRSQASITAMTALAVLVFYQPTRPDSVIANAAFPVLDRGETEPLFFAVGRSSTVLLTEAGGAYELRTNGLPEASVLVRGAPPVRHTQHWLAGLPVSARPGTSDMLVIGLGGGVALEGVPGSVDRIDVLELEPEVFNANRQLAELRAVDPLQDPRVTVIFNDARNALRLTSKTYDAIVSQPSHPWTAGASHLFTQEFVELAKSRLNDGGVFLQWMNAEFVDTELLRSLAATLLSAFANVRVYGLDGTVLYFLASELPLEIERQISLSGQPLADDVLHYSYMGLNGVEDFLVALMLDEEGVRRFADGAPLTTDDRNLMATRSRSRGDGLRSEQLTELFEPLDPLLDPAGWIHRDFGDDLNFAYLAQRLLAEGQVTRASRLSEVISNPSTQALVAAIGFEYNGNLASMNEALRVALSYDPGNVQARYKLVSAELPSFARRSPSAEALALAGELEGAPAAVVEAWPLGAEQDWQALADLDQVLGRSRVTDLWYPAAVKLRADWRNKVANRPEYANDALRLVDRVLVVRPELDLYVLRAASAATLADDEAFVESGRYVEAYLQEKLQRTRQGNYELSESELSSILTRLRAFENQLAAIAETEQRAIAVRDGIADLIMDYGQLEN